MSSPSQPDRAEVARTAQSLTDALNGVSDRLDDAKRESEARDAALKRYGHQNRVLIAVDVFLTVATICLAIWTAHSSSAVAAARQQAAAAVAKAAANSAATAALHSAQVIGCTAGNTYRAGVIASLDRLVALLEGPHPALVVQAEARAYERYVLEHNEPRDCTKAYALKPTAGR